jgi:hypothetical protein
MPGRQNRHAVVLQHVKYPGAPMHNIELNITSLPTMLMSVPKPCVRMCCAHLHQRLQQLHHSQGTAQAASLRRYVYQSLQQHRQQQKTHNTTVKCSCPLAHSSHAQQQHVPGLSVTVMYMLPAPGKQADRNTPRTPNNRPQHHTPSPLTCARRTLLSSTPRVSVR